MILIVHASTILGEPQTLLESHYAAVDYEVRQLLAEPNPHVRPTLPLDRRLRIAARLAAMSIFGRINRFARTSQPMSAGRQYLAELPSSPEPDEPGNPVTLEQLEEVIGTALFDPAPDAAVAFRHQQYAEFLAARYVTERGITRAQLRSLLGIQQSDRIPGALAGITAWVAAMAPDLVEDLLVANPIVLTQAGVEIPSDDVRAVVVDALLTTAARADIEPDWGLDLTGLTYPGLEDRLRRRFDEGLRQAEGVWWVSRLAEIGRCDGLAELLLAQALDSRWKPWARRQAAAAVASFDRDAVTTQLNGLLTLEASEDPDDELLASGIEALYPRLMSTADLLEVLRPRRNTSLVGAYLVLLGELSDRIPTSDLPAVLNWASERVRFGEPAYGWLIRHLVQSGWSNRDTASLLEALAGLVAATDKWYWEPWNSQHMPPWVDADTDSRRQLAVLVAERLDDDDWHALRKLELLTESDLNWLLAELPQLPTAAQGTLARAVPYLLDGPTVSQVDRILTLSEEHPAYEVTRSFAAPIALDSLPAQWAQKSRARAQRFEAEQQERRDQQQWNLRVALALTTDDISNWWKICDRLANDGRSNETQFSGDLTKRPGWNLLTLEEQQRVLDLGLQYVRTHEVGLGAEQTIREFTIAQVMPDWAGVYLLATLAHYKTSLLQALDVPAWQAWAPAVIAARGTGDEADTGLRCELINLAPQGVQRPLADAALRRLDALQEHRVSIIPRCVYEYLITELADDIGQRLVDSRYDGDLAATLLDILINHAPDVARPTCRKLRAQDGSPLAALAYRGLAILAPNDAVRTLAQATVNELDAVVPVLRLAELSDTSLAELGRVLLDRYPIADDPPWRSSDFSPYSVRRTRQDVLEHLAARGLTDALTDLRQGTTGTDYWVISAQLRRARDQAANLALTPLEPNELLALLSQADARLVRNSDDLLNVVIENLRELQHHITHGNTFQDLWNFADTAEAPKSEDAISDWIQRNLKQRLTNGGVVDRELQVRRRASQGSGTRIDLTATTATATDPQSLARVIIEAKLINHANLFTAMETQLMRRYLVPTGIKHGIYLVYWVQPDQRPRAWTRRNRDDAVALLQRLEQQAESLGDGLTVRPVVLDISRP